MPFSFLDIEIRKTRRIILLFLTLLCFYFIGAILIYSVAGLEFSSDDSAAGFSNKYSPLTLLGILTVAFLVALAHWTYSTRNMIPRLISVIGAKPIDPEDRYHLLLKNVIEEVSVATGGRQIEPYVVYSKYFNAFALSDLNGKSLIGVTEGLLTKMNRQQLESVVAHEASHIVWGDCLLATISCSIAAVYAGLLKIVASGWQRGSGSLYQRRIGFTPILPLLITLIAAMRFLTLLLNTWISRERELRADATAVRLTRNPQGLAESLYVISNRWSGNRLPVEELGAIFIMNPRVSKLEESSGFFANLFTTHPPIRKRIQILLDMAHINYETLESGIKQKPRTQDEIPVSIGENRIWYAQNKEKWYGPFSLPELSGLNWLNPFTWVTTEDNKQVRPAHEYVEINKLLKKGLPLNLAIQTCPVCSHGLEKIYYEGVPIWRCNNCSGRLLKQSHLQRIIVREEMEISQDIKTEAEQLKLSSLKYKHKYVKASLSSLKCPGCGQIMNRTFYWAVLPYHIEIDMCQVCDLVWFEQKKLEIIQYITEGHYS